MSMQAILSSAGARGAARVGAFISYARADGEAVARELLARLAADAPGLAVSMDRLELEGGVGWWKQIEQRLDRVEFLILVMTPAAMQSENTRREWRAARQRGVCVYPIKGVPESALDYASLPRWMHRAHFYDPGAEWPKLLAHLQRGCRLHRVPFMAPPLPPTFVARRQELTAIECRFVAEDASRRPVVLRAPGGYGKTSLAAALCHLDSVIEFYDDGVLWVTLGQTPDLLAELLKLYAAVTGERPGFVDIEDAARELALRLAEKNCLLVIDDAWSAAHVRPFLLAQGPRHLITTRVFEVSLGNERVDLGLMDPDDAVRLLLMFADVEPEDPAPYRALARRLGDWPLTLKLAGAAMRQRIARGDTPERALHYVGTALDRRGLTAFDRSEAASPEATVESTLARSLDLLDDEARHRYAELSIFPEDTRIPLAAVAALWRLDEFDTEELARRLDELALADFDLRSGTLGLHDVLRSLMAARLGDAAAAHGRLVDAWSSRPSDRYAWRWLAFHMRGAGRGATLRGWLLDPDWLAAKLAATDSYALAADFGDGDGDPPLQLVRDALRLSAPALGREAGQLAPQLRMRLMSRREPELAALGALLDAAAGPLLRPLHPSFDRPGGALAMTLLGPERGLLALAWTADGEQLIAVGEEQTLRIWTREGLPLHVLNLPATDLRCLALDAGSRVALCGSASGRLVEIDLHRVEVAAKFFDDPRRAIDAVALSRDGRRAATAGRGAAVHIWDLAAQAVTQRLPTAAGRVAALALSADDRVLVAGGDDGTIYRWDFASGAPLPPWPAHQAAVTAIAVSADGGIVVSGSSDRSLCVGDASTGRLRQLRGHEAAVCAVDLSPDGRYAISGAANRMLNLWQLADGALLGQIVAHTDAIQALRFSASSERAASASADHSVRIWRLDEIASERPREEHAGSVRALAFSADGALCASGGSEGRIKVWEVASGRCTATFGVGETAVQSLAFTPDGHCIVSGTMGGHYRLWIIETGEQSWLPVRHQAPVDHAAFSANSNRLVTSGPDRCVNFWDLASGSLLARYGTRRLFDHLIPASPRRAQQAAADDALDTYMPGEPIFQVQGIALSPDGRVAAISAGATESRLAGVTDVQILLIDIASGAIETVATSQTLPVPDFAVDPAGEQVVWSGSDHALRVSDGAGTRRYAGHEARVRGLAMARDRDLLLSCAADRSVRAWRLSDGEPVATLIGDSPMQALALSPDQTVVAVGDQQGRVHLLGLSG
ncbi:MAG: TIR domain-containing protein [Burkholderiales bacterium]|nr:TIR domain-containing protein [Burkholderiales bacterium]